MAETSAWRKNRGWMGAALAAVCGSSALAETANGLPDDAYGKWWTACDNAKACVVYGTGGDRGIGVTLIISRGAAASDPVRATIVADGPKAPTDTVVWRLTVDGNQSADLHAQPGRLMRADLAPDDALLLANRVAAGGELKLDGPGAGATLGLDGAAAALRRMDDIQDRSGGATAIIEPGRRPDRVGTPPALPVVDAQGAALAPLNEPPKTLRRAVKSCQRAFKSGPGDRQMRAFAMPGDALLWTIPCGRRGDLVYDLVMITRDGKAPEPALPGDLLDGIPRGVRGNVRFDPASGTLSETISARSSADCGKAADWVWSNGAFARVRQREMPECIGLPLDLWPDTYRATVRRAS